MKHVEGRRKGLCKQVENILPIAINNPDYIYKDWNNREDTLIFIKKLDENYRINVVIKIAIKQDEKHNKNSIITIIKIGEKTFRKIHNNKSKNLLYENIDKIEYI